MYVEMRHVTRLTSDEFCSGTIYNTHHFYPQTFESDCEMFKEACEEGEVDFELLEHNSCESKY